MGGHACSESCLAQHTWQRVARFLVCRGPHLLEGGLADAVVDDERLQVLPQALHDQVVVVALVDGHDPALEDDCDAVGLLLIVIKDRIRRHLLLLTTTGACLRNVPTAFLFKGGIPWDACKHWGAGHGPRLVVM